MPSEDCRTFSFRLYSTVRQQNALEHLLDLQRELYNAALEARRGGWGQEKRSTSYVDDCRVLTELREVRPEVLADGVVVCRGTLKWLDRAFASFYRRCQRGEKPGYPRFRSKDRFDSVQWEDRAGWKIGAENSRLTLQGIGAVKVKLHRPLRGVPKAITVKREGRHWSLSVRYLRKGEIRLAAAGRDLSQKTRRSKRRRKAAVGVGAIHRLIRNQRKDLLHKTSRRLVDD